MRHAIALLLALALSGTAWPDPIEVKVDFASPVGSYDRLSGVQGSPHPVAPGDADHTSAFSQFHVELCRFPQDCPPNTLTLAAIFPDAKADPDDPASYRFTAVDRHVRASAQAGCQILWQSSYDVGMSDAWKGLNLGGRAPRDLRLWGRVVKGCLEHFNNGWAGPGGARVHYVEFVNEPDGLGGFQGPERARLLPAFLEFLRIVEAYNLAHPQTPVQAVGPGVPLSWDAWQRYEKPLRTLLKEVRRANAKLPIFSFHTYGKDTSPGANQRVAQALRRALDAEGFSSTRLWNSEWQGTDFVRQRLGVKRREAEQATDEEVRLFNRCQATYALACKSRWQGIVDGSCYYLATQRCFPETHRTLPHRVGAAAVLFPAGQPPTFLAEQERLTWELARDYPQRCRSAFSPDLDDFSALGLRSVDGRRRAVLLCNVAPSPRNCRLSLTLGQPPKSLRARWTALEGRQGIASCGGAGRDWLLNLEVPSATALLVVLE